MLQTQVAYWSMKENQRHNLVSESQNAQDLARKERELDNTIRFNREQVSYWRDQLAELSRHNRVTEALTAEELTIKRSQATAALRQAEAALKQAEVAKGNLKVNAYNAKVNAYNAKTSRIGTTATANKAKAESSLTKQQTKTEKKRTKWYGVEKVAIPAVNASANVLKSVAALKSANNKKKKK